MEPMDLNKALKYAKSYVWNAHAGSGRRSRTGTDTARTGGFGTLNTPREALGYAVQHGGDRHSVYAAQSQQRETAKSTYDGIGTGQDTYSYAQFYPYANGAHGRLTVPACRVSLRWCSSTALAPHTEA